MPTVASVIEHLQGYKPDEHIATAIWCEEDVLGRAKEMGIKITRKKVQEILDDIEQHHDAELGISWMTLDCAIEDAQSTM
jgi:hypothetical protein